MSMGFVFKFLVCRIIIIVIIIIIYLFIFQSKVWEECSWKKHMHLC